MARREAFIKFLKFLGVFVLILALTATGLFFANNGFMRLAIWQDSESAYTHFEQSITDFNAQTCFDFNISSRMDSPSKRYSTTAKVKIVKTVVGSEISYSMYATTTIIKTYDLLLPSSVGTERSEYVYDDGILYKSSATGSYKQEVAWIDALNVLIIGNVPLIGLGVNPLQVFASLESEYETQTTTFAFGLSPLYIGVSKQKTIGEETYSVSVGMFGVLRGQSYSKVVPEGGNQQNFSVHIGYRSPKVFTREEIVPAGIAEDEKYISFD